ncbi:glycosyltransferase family 2 protein [Metapseudomonas lalkuanensis]|uniref:glycosyltransferase family 2 protein n=1 Tax=Metapseudomonas lalkuanensis TaxID=2604832 RepID=UPI001CF57685|nr:glycosyltransferase family 2 protein [Pseudomonas lalkuanensis]UCP00012.1 glycosyltransferase family 2 protein [Pseudomonas lalkuanensis]
MRLSRVFAVVVSYHPDLQALIELAKVLKEQVEEVVVVDNGSLLPDAAKLVSGKCHLLRLHENLGIATAQNFGIDYCLERGADAIVFLDQDSLPGKDLISILVAEFEKISADENLAAVSPVYQDSRYGFYYPLVRMSSCGMIRKLAVSDGVESIRVSCLISSGSLISARALRDVGFMRDDLFIDYVDTEWCLRARSAGYVLYAVPKARMFHSIGDKIIRLFVWRVPVHSPHRRYYRVRNAFILLTFPHVPILLALREVVQGIAHQLLLVATQAGRRLEYLFKGFTAVKSGLRICIAEVLARQNHRGRDN